MRHCFLHNCLLQCPISCKLFFYSINFLLLFHLDSFWSIFFLPHPPSLSEFLLLLSSPSLTFIWHYSTIFPISSYPLSKSVLTSGIWPFQACRRKILTVGREYQMARGYTSVGQMAPFYVFPCGHAFHAECLIAHVTRCTDETQVSWRIIFCTYLFLVLFVDCLGLGIFFLCLPLIFPTSTKSSTFRGRNEGRRQKKNSRLSFIDFWKFLSLLLWSWVK